MHLSSSTNSSLQSEHEVEFMLLLGEFGEKKPKLNIISFMKVGFIAVAVDVYNMLHGV